MLGPVLRQELRASSRRLSLPAFRWLCAAWLAWQLLAFLEPARIRDPVWPNMDYLVYPLPAALMLAGVVVQQWASVVVLTPALATGALTDEKARGTLQLLLTSALTPADIVLDKWLGRVLQAAAPALIGLPLLAYLGVHAELPLPTLVGLTVLWVGPLLGLAAAGVLASALCRTTTEALLLVYGGLALLLAVRWLGGPLSYLDPFYCLGSLQPSWLMVADGSLSMGGPPPSIVPPGPPGPNIAGLDAGLAGAALAWGSITVLCLGLATWRLRPAYRRQLEAASRGPVPAAVGPRPPVGEDPFRWKERYIEGVVPLALFRRVPRQAGVVLVVVPSVLLLAGVTLWCRAPDPAIPAAPVSDELVRARAEGAFPLQALAVAVFAALVVGVRCASGIAGERARQTWEPLLLTSLTAGEIVDGTAHGVLAAARPYALAYAVPALLIALAHGALPALWTACALLVGWQLVYGLAAVGVVCSTTARTAWGSTASTVAIGSGFVLGACVFAASATVGIGCLLFLVLMAVSSVPPLTALDPTMASAYGQGRWLLAILFAVLGVVLNRMAAEMLDSGERNLGKLDPPVIRH
jgi:hypothetical protein